MKLRTSFRRTLNSRVQPRTAIMVGFTVTQVATFATTIYLHRTLAHNALKPTRRLRWTCELIIRCLTGIEPNQWAAIHQQHHAHTDEVGDPHSPLLTSLADVQLHNVRMYQAAAATEDVLRRQAALDRTHPPLLPSLRGWRGLIFGIGAAVVIFGPLPGAIISFVHWPTYIMLNASINSLGHAEIPPVCMNKMGRFSHLIYWTGRLFGNRRHDTPDTSLNIPIWALVTAGEGLHNNHHAAPKSPTFALDAGETDPGWWAIRALQGAGLLEVTS